MSGRLIVCVEVCVKTVQLIHMGHAVCRVNKVSVMKEKTNKALKTNRDPLFLSLPQALHTSITLAFSSLRLYLSLSAIVSYPTFFLAVVSVVPLSFCSVSAELG